MSYRPAATLRGGCGAPPRPALLSLPRGGEVDGTPALGPCSMTMRVEPPMAPAHREGAPPSGIRLRRLNGPPIGPVAPEPCARSGIDRCAPLFVSARRRNHGGRRE